jgi:hypothetical protein
MRGRAPPERTPRQPPAAATQPIVGSLLPVCPIALQVRFFVLKTTKFRPTRPVIQARSQYFALGGGYILHY